MSTIAVETWIGSNGAAWPSQWQIPRGTSSIQSNSGQLTVPVTTNYESAHADLKGMQSIANTDAAVTIGSSVANGLQYVAIVINADGSFSPSNGSGGWYPDNAYAFELRYAQTPSSSVLTLLKMSGGTQTNLTTTTVTLVGTTKYRVRIQRIGTLLQAKFWDVSLAEPIVWSISTTLSTPLFSGIAGFTVGNGDGGVARSFVFDDLSVGDGNLSASWFSM